MSDNICHRCSGRGALLCNKCEGLGDVVCFKCQGTGHVNYIMRGFSTPGHGFAGGRRIGGTGFRSPQPMGFGGSGECNKCDATGRITCPKCRGEKTVPCLKCQGTGRYVASQRTLGGGSAPVVQRPGEVRTFGTVKFFSREKGFGFLTHDGTFSDVHVSARNLDGIADLQRGQRVSFVCRTGDKGLWAVAVRLE